MQKGRADTVFGSDYGDEGKGRIVDVLLENGDYTIACRFNGGPNAGHTLFKDGEKLILNSIPSGILYKNIINYIGSGCVVDPVHIFDTEIPRIKAFIPIDGRIKISALATAITPTQIFWDKATGKMVGTTGRGIGPAYADKARRAEGKSIRYLRLCDILAAPEKAGEIIKKNYEESIKIASALGMDIEEADDINERIDRFIGATLELDRNGLIEKDPLWMTKMVEDGKNVLMEGAQAFGLDITYGAAPFTTSSNTVAGNAYVGGDLAAKYHGKTYGVAKAIASRVGSGPFVGEFGGRKSERYCDEKDTEGKPKYLQEKESELYDTNSLLKSDDTLKFGIGLRMKTGEYGATTKRPRRVGMPDLFRLAFAVRRSGADKLYVTKMDCLKEYANNTLYEGKIPVITGYRLNGKTIDYVPASAEEQYDIEPVITLMPAIPDISDIRMEKDLPPQAIEMIELIKKITRCPIGGIGVGPERNQMVFLEKE